MKKLISVLLCLSLVFTVMAPAVFASENERLPVVYIRGNGAFLFDGEGNPLPTDLSGLDLGGDSEDGDAAKDAIVESVVNILKPFIVEGMLSDNWDNYGKAVYEELYPLFAGSELDENGNPKNGSGVSPAELASSEANAKSAWAYNTGNDYGFVYDWRLSPYDHVDRLHQFVLDIMAATGKTQINMYARCMGGSLLMAYIERYGHLGHIKNVMFVEILSNETTVISKAFSGKIEFDAERLEKYMGQLDFCGRYNMGVGFVFSDLLNDIVFKSMDFFNQITVTDDALDGVERLYARLYEALIPAVLHASGMATQVNYWTSVADEEMDDALELLFGKEGSELRLKYQGLVDKILYYREHISSDLTGFYDSLTEKGIHFGFTGKYGFLNAPFTEDGDLPSDALVSLTHATFGATAAKIGETLSDEYIEARIAEGKGKYISADKVVDLSTAYSPDTTWVFKNAHHNVYDPILPVVRAFLNGTEETVDTVKEGSQFMIYDYDTGAFSELTEDNCGDLEFMTYGEENPTIISIFTAFVRFFAMVANLLKMVFQGEFDLGSLLG